MKKHPLRHGFHTVRRAALALLAIAIGSCTDPNLPDPFPTDPQIGFLATLGKVPLFAADPSLNNELGFIYSFDDYGVGSPYVLINADGTYTMYFQGDDQPDSVEDQFASFAIGRANSDTEGQTWDTREIILVRRNLADDPGLEPYALPVPAAAGCGPGQFLENCYDANGVLDPMVFEDVLYYVGPGIPDVVLRSADDAEVPLVPSAIGSTLLPPVNQLARNGTPLLIANKAMTADDPVIASESDAFFNTLAGSFDPFTLPCDRKSFLPEEFGNASVTELNTRDSAAALSIRAGPYPWESGGVSSPFLIQNPYSQSETLMYYTCTEEYGRTVGNECEVRRIDRICVARISEAADGRLVAERLIREDSDVAYGSPYAPNIPLANNIVVGNGNFPGFDDVGSSDPTIEISQTITNRTVMRLWYTGTSEIGAQRVGITGSFDGFDWDADDATLRISTIVPTNPVLVQAAKAAKPASIFDANKILRVFYESASKGLASINMATIVRLDDTIPPTLQFISPQGENQVIQQGGSVTFRLRFEDSGGSGVDQSSFQIRVTSISTTSGSAGAISARNQITNAQIGDGTPPTLKINQDFNEEFPAFRFDVGDRAEVSLTLEDFKISPPLTSSQSATIRVEAIIFDRADISRQRAARNGVDITVVQQ